jgi:phytoene synthase
MTPDAYCQDRAARSGSSFYYSFMFLPPDRRRAITALYAYCREVDDVVDECSDKEIARVKLAWWRDEIARLQSGRPEHPVTQALLPHLQTMQIRIEHLNALIDGMAMDLDQNRYLDYEALQLYCHRVAGVVGIMSASIFGFTRPETLAYAERLGLAFQLTNIIRDVGEDARNGRIYLPLTELRRHGVHEQDLLRGRAGPEFVELMRAETERARSAYREALALLPDMDRAAQRPGLMMAAIYSTLLDEIERDGYRTLTHRTSLTPIRKLWLAWRTWRRPHLAIERTGGKRLAGKQ